MVVTFGADHLCLCLAADLGTHLVHVHDGEVAVDDHGRGGHGVQKTDEACYGRVHPFDDPAIFTAVFARVGAFEELAVDGRLCQHVRVGGHRLDRCDGAVQVLRQDVLF